MQGKSEIKPNHQQHDKGQSLIEFAIMLPILLLVILGAMDIARLFTTKIVLTNAAREGAGYLSTNPEYIGNTRAVVEAEAQRITFDGENDSIIVSCAPIEAGKCSQGGLVTVTVSKSVELIFGGFNFRDLNLPIGPILLSSTVEMMVR